MYTVLLLLVVALPRLLLAALAHWNARRLERNAQVPLQSPYFHSLLRDFASGTITVVVQPYSLAINDERRQLLSQHVKEQYGKAAHCQILPSVLYGKENASTTYLSTSTDAIHALLFNLSATPEKEVQGEAILQQATQAATERTVWILGGTYAERLGSIPDGAMRLAERKRLWQNFVQSYGLRIDFLDC